jgi:hypothetical protein
MLAVWEDHHLVEYSASHGALSGMWTKPFSIATVCACMRMVLVPNLSALRDDVMAQHATVSIKFGY